MFSEKSKKGTWGPCSPSLSWSPSWQLCLIEKLLRAGADPNSLDVGDEKDCAGTALKRPKFLERLEAAKQKGKTVLQRLYDAAKTDVQPVSSQIDDAVISLLTDAVYSSHVRSSSDRAKWPLSSPKTRRSNSRRYSEHAD